MKLSNLLSGTRILENTGKVKVIQDLAWGTYIQIGGLTQSGGIVAKIWQEVLKKVIERKPSIENCLILGFGGGSASILVSQYWVGSKITGVDVDEKIVKLGEKYLKLDVKKVQIVIADAFDFVSNPPSQGLRRAQYDLILVDLYNGNKFPKEFETDEFIKNLKKLVIFDGVVVFNRLYGTDNRSKTMKFGRKLEKFFKKVDYIYPQANLCFICYN